MAEWKYCYVTGQISEQPKNECAPFICYDCDYYFSCRGRSVLNAIDAKEEIENLYKIKIDITDDGRLIINRIGMIQ